MNFQQEVVYCNTHNLPITIYCVDDDCALCEQCCAGNVFGYNTHNNHCLCEFSAIVDVLKLVKERIDTYDLMIKKIRESYSNYSNIPEKLIYKIKSTWTMDNTMSQNKNQLMKQIECDSSTIELNQYDVKLMDEFIKGLEALKDRLNKKQPLPALLTELKKQNELSFKNEYLDAKMDIIKEYINIVDQQYRGMFSRNESRFRLWI